MATRKYEQRLRADSAEHTRRRILDAVAERLREAPTEPVSLDQVARTARVARSTIYLVFGSRAGLFDAFVDDLWVRTGQPALTAAVASPDALEHLRAGITAAGRMYAADRHTYRVLFSMAHLDPQSVGGALEKMESERAGGMAHLAHRLDEAGLLRDGLGIETATDLLWVFCSFDALDLLMTYRGLDVDAATGLLVTAAQRALCRQDA